MTTKETRTQTHEYDPAQAGSGMTRCQQKGPGLRIVSGEADDDDATTCAACREQRDTATRSAGRRKEAPFKFMLVDRGDWIITKRGDVRKAFKDYHGHAPSRAARLYVVPLSYGLTEGGLNYTVKRGAFEPVEVR